MAEEHVEKEVVDDGNDLDDLACHGIPVECCFASSAFRAA
jgi:hypothetical protein